MTTIARLTLAAFLLAGFAVACWKHGKTIPSFRFHAGGYAVGAAVEVLLIWAAGGWG